MENIVYLLGAGFSAPLGLPVISNFLTTARDIYYSDPVKYKEMNHVLTTINAMHTALSYYKVDLFNIEEILSILEMEKEITGKKKVSEYYENFIKVVINETTPEITSGYYYRIKEREMELYDFNYKHFSEIFFKSNNPDYKIIQNYICFILNLLNLKIDIIRNGDITNISITKNETKNIKYSIITLNYDLIIEKILNYLKRFFVQQPELFEIPLFKLHGSVDSSIILPTWKKFILNDKVQKDWEGAYNCLKDATQIRILGYSLPKTDNYIKYLLVAAAQSKEMKLKNIDIICMDDINGTIENRYDEYIPFTKKMFVDRDINQYLQRISSWGKMYPDIYKFGQSSGFHLGINNLENVHKEFMSEDGTISKFKSLTP
jgi:hypothetical protein